MLVCLPASCTEHAVGAPELLTVTRLDPTRVSAGDPLVLRGAGFPRASEAKVTFRGDLYRPGAVPEFDVRIDTRGRSEGLDALKLEVLPDLERRFTGAGPRAVHTTFQGEIRVEFPTAPGGARVAGTLRGARLDILPRAGQPTGPTFHEGVRALAFLGLTAERRSQGPGLLVTEVAPEGRGAMAGVLAGDVVVEFADVTVLAEDDIRVASGTSHATLRVERGARRLPPFTVDVAGLSPRGVADLAHASAVLLSACILLALPATRAGLVLRWLTLLPGLDFLSGAGRGTARASSRPGLLGALVPRSGGPVGASATGAVAALAATAFLALGHSFFGPDVDLLSLLLGSTLSLVAARCLAARAPAATGRFFARVGSAALHTLVLALPAVVALLGAILASGRFVVAEIVAEQGGAPWRWAGFRSPGLFALLLVLLTTALPQAAADAVDSASVARGASHPPGARGGIFLALAEGFQLWLTASLAVLLFLGGSRVPGVPSMVQEASPWLSGLGLCGFGLKVALLAAAICALRRAAGGVRPEHAGPLAVRHGIPVSVGALLVTVLFAGALDGADSPLAADISGTAFFFLSAVVVAGAAFALGRRTWPRAAGVNPWL